MRSHWALRRTDRGWHHHNAITADEGGVRLRYLALGPAPWLGQPWFRAFHISLEQASANQNQGLELSVLELSLNVVFEFPNIQKQISFARQYTTLHQISQEGELEVPVMQVTEQEHPSAVTTKYSWGDRGGWLMVLVNLTSKCIILMYCHLCIRSRHNRP